MFPEELPKRLIKMFAFKGETVLDPFLGSGTTSLAAKNLERNSIGYEVNPEFIEIAKNKLNIKQSDIAGTTYEFLKDEIDIDIEKEFDNLPYRFVDFQNLDKKIDPKKLQFGSKIDKNTGQREDYYTVKEIISPELIKLNTDLVVRLIGVKEKKNANGSAKQFLYNKTKGQKVFMKFDDKKYDDQNNLMCYLYLKNKTFLNAHLIKEGFAEPDTSFDFKYKNKFKSINSNNGK
jgi:site-specific DNA-methyltransferase (adenine-specific)